MTKLLVDEFSYLTYEKVAQQVLAETYEPPPGTHKYVVEFLQTLIMLASIRKLGPVDLFASQLDNSLG